MKAALERRLTLIQGPPGTGKTHTSVAIVRGMLEIGHGPVLCTSDSNTAVDNMVEGLAKAGVNVIRLGRPEAVRPDLARYQIENAIPPGATKHEAYQAQLWAVRNAQAVCATCSGSGSDFLDRINFSAVMLDEASQVTEPMSLVPLANGCQQLVLVGDHKQLPPTVVSRDAELAGMTLSLFDRLIRAGVQLVHSHRHVLVLLDGGARYLLPVEAIHHPGANAPIRRRLRPRRLRASRAALSGLPSVGADVRHGQHARLVRQLLPQGVREQDIRRRAEETTHDDDSRSEHASHTISQS